jgi:3-keto-L-gulonate-6-phosphate decarboxylase
VIQQTFGVEVAMLAVIHLSSRDQGVTQAKLAFDAGADGVFLIDHSRRWPAVAEAADALFDATGGWVGVDALDLTASESMSAFLTQRSVKGVWVDNAGTDERSDDQPLADAIDDIRRNWDGVYFDGTAFEYQRAVTDLVRAGAVAAGHMDVVCTSGSGTGTAPDEDHVRQLALGAGRVPVAVASGVNVANVGGLARAGARAFLVASSIAATFDTLDPERTRALADAVHATKAA